MFIPALVSMLVPASSVDCGYCTLQLCCQPIYCVSCDGTNACNGTADVPDFYMVAGYPGGYVLGLTEKKVLCYTTYVCLHDTLHVCPAPPGGWRCDTDWANAVGSVKVQECVQIANCP